MAELLMQLDPEVNYRDGYLTEWELLETMPGNDWDEDEYDFEIDPDLWVD